MMTGASTSPMLNGLYRQNIIHQPGAAKVVEEMKREMERILKAPSSDKN